MAAKYTAKIGSVTTGNTACADVTLNNNNEFIFDFTLPKGDKGDKGDDGDIGGKGDTGDKGETGYGMPAGGTNEQILVKNGNADYSTTWKNINSISQYIDFTNRLIPTGGSVNQVLVRTATSYAWKTLLGTNNGGSGGGSIDDSNFLKLRGQEKQTIEGIVEVTGQVHSTDGFYETSDVRLKNVIGNADIDIEKIINLSIVYFTFKNDEKNKQHIGVIAQEIAQICPEMVEKDKDGYLTVDYSKLSLLCLYCLKDLYGKLKK